MEDLSVALQTFTLIQKAKNDDECYNRIKNYLWHDIIDEMYPLVITSLKSIPTTDISEAEVIRHLWQDNVIDLKKIRHWIHVWVHKESNKNEKESDEFRSVGNEYFKVNKLEDSAFFYTRSILSAPCKSVQLAVAFANRSAVAYQNHNYEKCICDIKQCLNNPYPNYLKHKVFFRLANCYCNTGNFCDAQRALDGTRIWLLEANITEIKKDDIEKLLNNLQLKINDKTSSVIKSPHVIEIPEPTYGNNTEFLYASSAIALRNSTTVGRYVTAMKDIKKGDILFSEEPYATVLVEKKFLSCFHCGVECDTSAVPCPNCVNSYYCSEKCQQLAWELYHRWECAALSSELTNSIGLGYLALKIVLKGAHVNFNSKQDLKNFSIPMNNYASVFNLVSNINKMSLEDISLYSLTAVMLTTYLEQKTDFFAWYLDKWPMNEIESKNYISTLLLRHICQIQCNASILQVRNKCKDIETNLCSAICPSASMMNHSCDSNIVTDFFNHRLIVRAAKDINIGEEISNSYGTRYTLESFGNRQSKLSSQYYFTCKCVICTSNDSEIKYHYELFNAYKCTSCKGRVLINHTVCFDCKCSAVIDFVTYDNGVNFEKQGLYSIALKYFEICLHKYNIKIRELCEKIACEYEENRMYEDSLIFHKRIIKMLKKQCGDNSILVTNQMIKTSFLILKYIQVLEFQHSLKFKHETINGLKFLKQTKERTSYLYGPWNHVCKMVNQNLETAEKLLESYNRKISKV